MPKIKLNEFINPYKTTRICVFVAFPDYLAAKKKLRRGTSVIKFANGKVLPSPNQTISALVREIATADYAISSGKYWGQSGLCFASSP